MTDWLEEAEKVCKFSDPDDWIEKKPERKGPGEDLYFYENHQIAPPGKKSVKLYLNLFFMLPILMLRWKTDRQLAAQHPEHPGFLP